MHWKTKSKIQNVIFFLPESLSYGAYYWIQRHFGSLRKIDPLSRFRAGIETWKLIKKLGHDPCAKTFFEVGTGRLPVTPTAYWLMGAKKVITIDINPYMKDELLRESMRFVLEHTGEIENLFGTLLDRSRLTALLDFCKTDNFPIEAFLDLCNIDYIAPGDAANTNIPDGHIDFHTSYNVLEHIPPATLKEIIKEGNRLVRSSGLFIHKIDYSDHFSHSDKTISTVNFLQYSAAEWNRYAGNRFMYMNRLRHDDFIQLFESMGHKILFSCPESDPVALDLLEKGRLTLDRTYQSKPNSVLAIVGSWLVTQNTIKAGSYTNYDLTIQSTSDKTN